MSIADIMLDIVTNLRNLATSLDLGGDIANGCRKGYAGDGRRANKTTSG